MGFYKTLCIVMISVGCLRWDLMYKAWVEVWECVGKAGVC